MLEKGPIDRGKNRSTGPSDYRTLFHEKGPIDQGIIGLSDPRSKGPFRIIGLSDPRSKGPFTKIGLSDPRSIGPSVYRDSPPYFFVTAGPNRMGSSSLTGRELVTVSS